jgi:hypothetical protein
MSRPMTLREAAAVAISGEKSFGDSIDEFLDTFYLDHRHRWRHPWFGCTPVSSRNASSLASMQASFSGRARASRGPSASFCPMA